jgi:hypothetical protein
MAMTYQTTDEVHARTDAAKADFRREIIYPSMGKF